MPRDITPQVRQELAGLYQIEREIGRGGAAVVFLARAPDGTPVALKALRPELAAGVAAQRFLREITFISRLNHPSIGKVLDAGMRNWLVYYVMPYYDGPSLQEHLVRQRSLTPAEAIRMGTELLDALHHAHQHDIIHRDVKPDNIILTSEGARLLDFGIARAIALSGGPKLTQAGIAVGTADYMSPEQISASPAVDHRTDVYSVGCVLFECLAGRAPFHHRSDALVLDGHLNHPAPDLCTVAPSAPAGYAAVVARALRKQAAERWASAHEMLEALAASA
ncbi:MAG: serine/threonine protein kinase [Gemmatimonadota bacterium]|jgi:serine/threonine protein kinase|nr:serine/threonine protein kinase [Gemmatimonadota bacterium]